MLGWCFSRDLLSTQVYEGEKTAKAYRGDAKDAEGKLIGELNCLGRFIFGELEERKGEVPEVWAFFAPQREKGEGSSERVREVGGLL